MPSAASPHWTYYQTICTDVRTLDRYVSLTQSNFEAHSVECLRLLFSTCSEIDVVQKLFCEAITPGMKARNIDQYADIVLPKHPTFAATSVDIPLAGISLGPWGGWQRGKAPVWWRAYNDVKHERARYFEQANLGNLLAAVAGLFVLLTYYEQKALSHTEWRRWEAELIMLSAETRIPGPSRTMMERIHQLR